MTFACRSDFSMELRNLRAEELFLFRAITAAIAEGDSFPWLADPVVGEATDAVEIRDDWENFVRPDLMAASQREVDVLIADLATAQPMAEETGDPAPVPEEDQPGDEDGDLFFATLDPGFMVEIPSAHIDAWYGALNQARLAIESRHRFSSRRVEPADLEAMSPEEQLAFWQWITFAATQEALLRCMEARFDSGS
ncbi:MAG: hypothetical protein ACKO2G_06625 [Verrucomicrobiales bacterium]